MITRKKKQSDDNTAIILKYNDPPILKYPRPKILLVDMKDETGTVLKAEGYNVTTGSFGTPYRVVMQDNFVPVIVNGFLPIDFTEQEIVVIDLVPAKALPGPSGDKHTSKGETDWWASCNRGMVDPRPRLMNGIRKDFDRIYSHGGVFIIFADHQDFQKLVLGYLDAWSDVKVERDISFFNNWCFLSILDLENLEVSSDRGQEILVVEKELSLAKLMLEHMKGAYFLCTLKPKYKIENSWLTLSTNKYGAPVAGAITPEGGEGWIFIFPQLRDKTSFLTKFFKHILPELSPHMFPHVEGGRWVYRPEYELPRVVELKNSIEKIQGEARKQVVNLEKAIEEERYKLSYLHDLIRETDRPLVNAVKKTLEVISFQSVVDIDEEMKKAGDTGLKREDLQIHDYSPILLVEVKGISGLPKDTAALQVWKYLAPRMKEWNRTDIHGLSIINHQRNLPGLDRENKSTFREDILTNAQEQGFGLLTTWDLYRLTRCYQKYGWKHEYIKPLFYQSGRIDPVPTHYEFIGVVDHFWEKAGAVGVIIKTAELRQGDRIAFELPVEFEEQDVDSLQVDKQPVAQATIGMLAGIKTHLTKEQAKKGIRVFRLTDRTTL